MVANKETIDIVYEVDEWKDIDTDELHKAIKAELGDKFTGLTTVEGEMIILHMSPDARGVDKSAARRLFDAHDKSKIPPKPKVKTLEERFEEMANEIAAQKTEIAALKAKNAQAQAAAPKK